MRLFWKYFYALDVKPTRQNRKKKRVENVQNEDDERNTRHVKMHMLTAGDQALEQLGENVVEVTKITASGNSPHLFHF